MSTADLGGGAHAAEGTGHVPPPELRDASFGELLSGLASDVSVLVKQEIQLAKVEMSAKAKDMGKGAGMLVGAAVFGLLMMMALTALLIIILDAFLELWLAALIVTVLWGVVAAVLALGGKKELQKATPIAPQQTIETVKEDVQWAKNPTQSART